MRRPLETAGPDAPGRPEIRGTKAPHWSAPWSSPETFGHFGRSGTLLWVDPVPILQLQAERDYTRPCIAPQREFPERARRPSPILHHASIAERDTKATSSVDQSIRGIHGLSLIHI